MQYSEVEEVRKHQGEKISRYAYDTNDFDHFYVFWTKDDKEGDQRGEMQIKYQNLFIADAFFFNVRTVRDFWNV